MWINWLVVSTLLHQSVYSHFFFRFWTNDVTNFPKVTSVISPPTCHLRFLIFVLETFNSRRKDWQCSQYLTLYPTCAITSIIYTNSLLENQNTLSPPCDHDLLGGLCQFHREDNNGVCDDGTAFFCMKECPNNPWCYRLGRSACWSSQIALN